MKKKRHNKIKIIIPILVLILLGIGFILYFHYDSKNTDVYTVKTNASNSKSSTSIPAKSIVSSASPSSISYSAPSDNGQSVTTEQPTTGTPPTSPSGEFLSNYSPDSSTSERSVCNVQPGVSCTISFTQGDVTKNLTAEVAGSDGFVLWTWEPSDLSLTTGSWQVKATATVNSLSSTTTDPNLLNVQ